MIKLDKVVENAMKRRVMEKWRPPKSTNPWFRKVASMLARNSRINVQVSYWRMRDSALSSGGSLDTLKIVKCKKLFNNLRKAYDKTMTRALLAIENIGKPQSEL